MSYMKELEEQVKWWLNPVNHDYQSQEEWEKAFISFIKEKILESYRNGQRDCPKCNPRKARATRAAQVERHPQN